MTTASSFLSKPLCMSEGSGTLAKKKNPEPPPAQGIPDQRFCEGGRYRSRDKGTRPYTCAGNCALLRETGGAQMTSPQMRKPRPRAPARETGQKSFATRLPILSPEPNLKPISS